MPREVTLFTDDGHWAAVVTAWAAHYLVYHDLGVRVRVYRMGVPPTWGSGDGPWSNYGWLGGPWKSRGPWGAWGPWRLEPDGPWQFHHYGSGPWGGVLPWSWVETRVRSIAIEAHYRALEGPGEVTRRRTAGNVSFLRLTESGFGFRLVLRNDDNKPVPVDNVWGTVDITIDDRVTLHGQVTTAAERPEAGIPAR